MTTRESCPKCHVGTLSGPRYERSVITGAEWLNYTCSTCGYAETRPTKDKQQPSGADLLRGFIGQTRRPS